MMAIRHGFQLLLTFDGASSNSSSSSIYYCTHLLSVQPVKFQPFRVYARERERSGTIMAAMMVIIGSFVKLSNL
jgi:hypothetical protein